jgi:hypothetical protein
MEGLQEHLDRLVFAERSTDEVTELLIEAVLEWATQRGWRAYRRAASVVPLPPPYDKQFSVVDVGIARPGQLPIVVEVDHADRKRTLDKLAAEAAAGRVALWVRWGAGPFTPPEWPVHMVTFRVVSRRGRHSHTVDRPAPEHTETATDFESPPLL